jgi:hypothetical protein
MVHPLKDAFSQFGEKHSQEDINAFLTFLEGKRTR